MVPATMPNYNCYNDSKFYNPDEGFLRGNMIRNEYDSYKNMKFKKPEINNSKDMLMYDIQKYSFAAHDLNLYLEINPSDKEALRLYNEYNNKTDTLIKEYESCYGPINLMGTIDPWTWIDEPWPWNV